MSTYAVGDVQGCRAELEELLAQVSFDAAQDRALFVGDLVNRGPDSLGALRLIRSLGDAAVVVLGNHDLHLLASAVGARPGRTDAVYDAVASADDGDDLLDWLRTRPLLHREAERLVVHAGLAPAWSVDDALDLARELESRLRGPRAPDLLARYHSCGDRAWNASAADDADPDRLAVALRFFTRVRMLDAHGCPSAYSGPPGEAPSDLTPWFRAPGRRSEGAEIVFGHWAALGFHREPGVLALDSGCVWGNELTAVRLEDDRVFAVPAHG